MDIVTVVLTSLTLMISGVVLLGIFSLFNVFNRHNEINITTSANLNQISQQINRIESHNNRINDVVQITKLRTENALERMWKIENMLTHVMSTTQNFMNGLEQLANEGQSPMRGLIPEEMQGGHVIRATSMEDFLQQIQKDPYFQNITPEQLEELRKIFEQNLNDEDEPDEPWKEE